MHNATFTPIGAARRWPMTRKAWDRLLDELAQLREELTFMTGQGLEEGIVQLSVAVGMRRLETLKDVRDRCELVDDERCVVIGRRATLRDPDGSSLSYEIGFPGDGDPDMGSISADSPLGAAILGARPGDVVQVVAPAGAWSVEVLEVD